jgi:hypothetical protein
LLVRALARVREEVGAVPGGAADPVAPVVVVLDLRTPRHWGFSLPNHLESPCVAYLGSGVAEHFIGNEVPSGLGPCRYVAAYGRPGSGVQAWAHRFGGESYNLVFAFPRWRGNLDERGRLVIDASEIGVPWRGMRYDPNLVSLLSCAAGEVRSCETTLASPWNARLRGDFVEWQVRRDSGVSFRKLWRHEGTLESAFAAAWGVSMGELAARWASERVVVRNAGPRVALEDLAGAAAFVTLAGVIAVAVSRRRSTG